jgi:two-component system, NarL family, sensor kinase
MFNSSMFNVQYGVRARFRARTPRDWDTSLRYADDVSISDARGQIIVIEQRSVQIAWFLGLTTIVLLSGAVTLTLFNRPTLEELDYYPFLAACAIVGSLIVAHRPRNPVGWLLATGALAFTLMAFSGHYALYGLETRPGSLPSARWIGWPQTWLWIPGAAMIYLLLPLYFPTGELLSPRWRWLVRGIVLLMGTGILIGATTPGQEFIQVQNDEGTLTNPLGVAWARDRVPDAAVSAAEMLIPLVLVACLGAATVSMFLRLRRSRGIERQQMKWFALVVAVLTVFAFAPRVYEPVSLITGAVLIGIPVTVGIAIIRHDLYDIDIILNRALVYGTLTACVAAGYVVIVGGLGFVLHERFSALVSLLAAGVIAVLFQPLREVVQRRVNQMLYGERDDPYRVLTRLGHRLESTLTPDAVLPGIVETIQHALRLPYAAIALKQGDELVIAAASGVPAADAPRLPLVYGNETVGELLLAPRRPGESFTATDLRLLSDLARQIGVAAHAVRLTDDLQRSRERLVTAREEERRRLRRDLHDGLGPALASFTLQAEAARDLLRSDPDEADSLLGALVDELQAATADIRRLVYELRPPALDDLGLVPAIRAYAARFDRTELRVTVEATEPMPGLPAAVEVAAYRIVQEALTNVVKHARATSATIGLRVNGGLVVTVEDDGIGIADVYEPGVGLGSMRERAEELGGTLLVERMRDGGTRVTATLPGPSDGGVEPGVEHG